MRNESARHAYKRERHMCVWRTNGTNSSSFDDDDTNRRRRRLPLHTHTVSHIYIYTHTTYRVTDEGNNGHINGNPPQQQQDTFTSLFPTCPPTAPSRNTHTTQLILHHITQDDNCQHSYKDPWPPLTHIVNSYTPSSYTHTPLAVPPHSISSTQ